MNNQQEMHLALPVSLAQGICNYLASRPWSEVHEAMAALKALQPIPPVVQEEAPKA
jgi:hypothetical protein